MESLEQAVPSENPKAGGAETLAADLVPRESLLFNQDDIERGSGKQQRGEAARGAGTDDDDIRVSDVGMLRPRGRRRRRG